MMMMMMMKCRQCDQLYKKKKTRPALALIMERDRLRPCIEIQSRQELEYVAWARRIQDETINLPGSLQLLSAETVSLWFQMCDVSSLWALSTSCRALRGRSSAYGTASLVEVTAAFACRDLYRKMRPRLPASHCVPFGSALLPLVPHCHLARESWLARLRCLIRGAPVIAHAIMGKSGLVVIAAEITQIGIRELSRRPFQNTENIINNNPVRGGPGVNKALDLIAMNNRGSLILLQRAHDPFVETNNTSGGQRQNQNVPEAQDTNMQRPRRLGSWDEEDSTTTTVDTSRSDRLVVNVNRRDFIDPGNESPDTEPSPINTSSVIKGIAGAEALRWDPSTARWHAIPIWSGEAPTKCAALRSTNFRRAVTMDLLGRLILASCECRRAGADRRHRPRPPFDPDRDEYDDRPWYFARRKNFAAGPEEDFPDEHHDDNIIPMRATADKVPQQANNSIQNYDFLGCDANMWIELPSLVPWRPTATIELVCLDFRPRIGIKPDNNRIELFQQEIAQIDDLGSAPIHEPVNLIELHNEAYSWLVRHYQRRPPNKDTYSCDKDDSLEGGILLAVCIDGRNSLEVGVSVYGLDEDLGTWVLIAIAPNKFRGFSVTATAFGNDLIVASNPDNAMCLNLEDLTWRPCRMKRGHQFDHSINDVPDISLQNRNQHVIMHPPAPPTVVFADAANQADRHRFGESRPPNQNRFTLLPGPTPDAAAAILLTHIDAVVFDLKRDPRTRRVYLQRIATTSLVRSSLFDTKFNGPPYWTTALLPLTL